MRPSFTEVREHDDWAALSQRIVARQMVGATSHHLAVIFVDGWFDAKWKGFSGKCMGAFGVWKASLTAPPFHPSRVLSEAHFNRVCDEAAFQPTVPPRMIHGRRDSESNLRMEVQALWPNADLFWISSPSPERLALMHYGVRETGAYGWYLSLEHQDEWRRARHRGLSAVEIDRLIASDTGPSALSADLDVVSHAWKPFGRFTPTSSAHFQ